MVIQHNLVAMNSNRMLNSVNKKQNKSTEKLSSGYKINRAADDAAGLSISEKMRKQIRGLTQASANAQDGISLVQVADGALAETTDILQRLNELSIKSANGTLSDEDRGYIQNEVDQLLEEVDRIANTTSFNSSIYPLRHDKIVDGLYCFDDISTFTYNYKNESTTDQTLNGQPWNVGDSILFSGIQFPPNGNYRYWQHFHDGMATHGSAEITTTEIRNVGNVGTLYDGSYSLSKDDIQVDSEGKLHYTSKINGLDYYFIVNNNPADSTYYGNISRTTDPNNSHFSYIKYKNYHYEGSELVIQAGADGNEENKISISTVNATAEGLGLDPFSVSTAEDALNAIDAVGEAIKTVSSSRSYFGSIQNRLEHTISNLNNVVENTTAAESQIRDTDMATEMVRLSNNNILAQAGQAMLAQANQSSQGVLSLLS